MTSTKAARLLTGVAAMAVATPASAQETPPRDNIIVIAPGGDQDEDDASFVTTEDIARGATLDVLQAFARTQPGISLQDAQNNPWQPNLVYRGYVASPLQGNSQGLAVYLDGGRFNQAFGDTVQFDLLPEAAIDSIAFKDANPVYGLNALGGAVAITTKTGRSAPGFVMQASGGSFGSYEMVASGGVAGERSSAFAAIQVSGEDGWRDFSPSKLVNGFIDLGHDGDNAGIHLKLIGADNDLTGNGVSPVELLAADRDAVFTHPDNTKNRYGRASLHPWVALGANSRVEATLYVTRFEQRTVNGDLADIEACEDEENEGFLCTEDDDDEALLTDVNGDVISDVLDGEGYGFLNRTATDTTAGGALVQFVDKRSFNGGENVLVLGGSIDASRTDFNASNTLGELTETREVIGLGPVIDQDDNGPIVPVSVIAHTRHVGIFAHDSLPLAPGLTAELGVRWNYARIEMDDQLGTALDGLHVYRRLNPGAELDWEVTPSLSLRAGYSEANRAPTPAELACADEEAPCSLTNFFVGDPPLLQVVSRTFELGASGKVGGFEYLVSAYRATNSDDIQFVASSIRGRAYFRNVGKTRRQGVEASIGYRMGGLALRAGYAYTDATFRTPFEANSPDNPGADDDGLIQVGEGDRLPGIPRHRGVVSADYDGDGFSIGADVQAQSGVYLVGDEANLIDRTDGFVIANARASIDLGRNFQLFGEVRNLFDRDYETFGTFSEVDEIELEEAPDADNPRALGPGSPRRFQVGLRVRI